MTGRMRGTKVKQCPHCEGRFEQRRIDQIYCSTPCRLAFHNDRYRHLRQLGEQVEANAKSESK